MNKFSRVAVVNRKKESHCSVKVHFGQCKSRDAQLMSRHKQTKLNVRLWSASGSFFPFFFIHSGSLAARVKISKASPRRPSASVEKKPKKNKRSLYNTAPHLYNPLCVSKRRTLWHYAVRYVNEPEQNTRASLESKAGRPPRAQPGAVISMSS